MLLGTFFLVIVAMNLIVAVMVSTYQKNQSLQQQNSLKNQLDYIYDFTWVMNLQKRFSGNKYIIYLQPDDLKEKEEM